MSADPIIVVAKDTLPSLRLQFLDDTTGAAINCAGSGWTAHARFREAGAIETLFQASMTRIDGGISGWWLMAWPTNALDVDPGAYELQATLIGPDGTQTATTKVKVKVRERFAEVVA